MDESRAKTLVSCSISFTFLSLLFMLLRFCCKVRYGRKFEWADYILAFSWVLLLASAGLTIAATRYQFGEHNEYVSQADREMTTILIAVEESLNAICIGFAQTSVALSVLRFTSKPWEKALIWFIILSVQFTKWLSSIFVFTACTPITRRADPTIPGECWDLDTLATFSAFTSGWSGAMNFVVVIISWYLIWRTQMRIEEKIGLVVVFGLGIISTVAAAIKTCSLVSAILSPDASWSMARMVLWMLLEAAVIIMAASIPYLRLMLKEASRSVARSLTVGDQAPHSVE
ncbi:hypothetical protein B0T17DRAFT_257252 [Bombardia bombarda]|uniref:Rhodopsin domain-containing protein n=1 Tax=Bombardia bombarda TaxID=252184 RepID=A0AA39X0E8_9PEZI|nr:hypothetical protein B0T17DRAFT_257252 [Bombardia bombarda]